MERIINERRFTKILCPCGCGRRYWKWLNPEEPSKYEVISYTNEENKKPLEIKRLKDGQTFRLGDTIKRISATGKVYKKCVLYRIQVEENGFMQLLCSVVDYGGSVAIKSDKHCMENGQDPDLFNLIENITNNKRS